MGIIKMKENSNSEFTELFYKFVTQKPNLEYRMFVKNSADKEGIKRLNNEYYTASKYLNKCLKLLVQLDNQPVKITAENVKTACILTNGNRLELLQDKTGSYYLDYTANLYYAIEYRIACYYTLKALLKILS